MPQPQADKLLRHVAQPLGRHYNGQGVVRESTYLPLGDDSFSAEFEERWNEHVDFGRAWRGGRSAQSDSAEWKVRLAAKKERSVQRPGPSGSDAADAPALASGTKRKREPAASAPQKTRPSQKTLANTGRFGGTLAARLLAGS